jgi:glycine/D-amino acid oxidase-like deaminating enzyme
VAIVGAGLAGLGCALKLAQGGVRVLVLEANEALGEGAVGRGNGLVHLGLCEHPIQLVDAIGAEDAAALLKFSARSVVLLGAQGEWTCRGGLWCGSLDGEDEGIRKSTAWLQDIGLACEELTGDGLDKALGHTGFSLGRFHGQEGVVDPRALLGSLGESAIAAGACLCLGHGIEAVEEGKTEFLIHGPLGTVSAEMIVFAAGWRCAEADPWFREKVFPVRAQHLWEAGDFGLAMGGRTQHGYVSWAPTKGGRLVSGCRWGSPHMEVGETQDQLNPGIGAHLARFMDRFGSHPEAERLEWTSVMDFTCDALPILGPLPGQARKVACAGFNGQNLGLALASAEAVSKGILADKAPGIPERLHASRFV